VHHFNRPKISNNSLIRDQKSNKHIANGYKKLVHTFKREAVQLFVAKNLAVNHLPLEALPAVQTWTANCKRDRKAVVTWHFAVCGLPFPTKNLMLKVPILSDRPLNTDTRIIPTLWHVILVSMLTRFHCTTFTSVIYRQVYSLVIVSKFEILATLANHICFTRWCPQSNLLKWFICLFGLFSNMYRLNLLQAATDASGKFGSSFWTTCIISL